MRKSTGAMSAALCRPLLVLYALLTGALTGWTLLVSQARCVELASSPECSRMAFLTVVPQGKICEYQCVGHVRLAGA